MSDDELRDAARGGGMAVTAQTPLDINPMIRHRAGHIGRAAPRREDRSPLLGRQRYIADVKLPGMLEAVFVRSPVANARIVSIDAEAARALPGVVAVYTAADLGDVGSFPHTIDYIRPVRQRPLAEDRVRYVGSPYAVVAAADRYAAEDAAALVSASAELETLPAVAGLDRSLAGDAPRLYEDWPDNRLVDFPTEKPEVARAFAEADGSFTASFVSQRQTGLPLECRGVVADSSDGGLTVWSSTQSPHIVRTTLAGMLGVAEPQVRVITPAMGGGFGAKTHVYPEEVVIAWLARRLGRPVRWLEDRLENLVATAHARDQRHDVEVAYDEDGTLRAVRCTAYCDVGSGEIFMPGTAPVFVTAACITGGYDFPNMQVHPVCAVTNKTPSGAYRGFGVPEGMLVMEGIIDKVARLTGTDRVEMRRRMLLSEEQMPYTMHGGGKVDSGSHARSFERVLELIGPAEERARARYAADPDVRVGVGYANYVEPTTPTYHLTTGHWAGYDAATLRVDPDGKARVGLGVTALGQGTETVAAQLTAEALGLHPSDVTVVMGDTERAPYGLGAWGSRSAIVMSGSILMAADRLLAKAREIASHMLEADAEDVILADGGFHVAGSDEPRVDWARVATAAWARTVDLPRGMEPGLEMSGYFEPPDLEHLPDAAGKVNAAASWSNGAHAGVVSVRISTGEVRIEEYAVVHDCGTMLNPMIVDGQVQGGVAQGIAGAMYEHFQYDPETAQPRFASFMEYLFPTCSEVPPITIDHFQTPAPGQPLGVKGCGEGGTIGPPAVVAGAVSDALAELGVEIWSTPVTPDAVRRAIREAAGVKL